MRLELRKAIIVADRNRIERGMPVINSIRNLAREMIRECPRLDFDVDELAEWLRLAYNKGFDERQNVCGLTTDEVIKRVCKILECAPNQLKKEPNKYN